MYQKAKERAAAAGFGSVEAFVADLVADDLLDADNFDHLFTPAVVADLRRISTEADGGAPTFTSEELRDYLRKVSANWSESGNE